MQFSNLFSLYISCDNKLFSNYIAISVVGGLSLLVSSRTDLIGKFSLLIFSFTLSSEIDVDNFFYYCGDVFFIFLSACIVFMYV